MKRWDLTTMLDTGRKLFAKIHKQRHHAHHNHDIHFLARELEMEVLQERRLRLSGKKTRIGSIDRGFHFLGIQYPKTQPLDNTTMTQAVVNVSNTGQVDQNQSKLGG